MAKSLTLQAFGALSPETLAAIEAEEKTNALREANFRYEARRRGLEDKFSTALSTLREQYLQEVLSIHRSAACSLQMDEVARQPRRGLPRTLGELAGRQAELSHAFCAVSLYPPNKTCIGIIMKSISWVTLRDWRKHSLL